MPLSGGSGVPLRIGYCLLPIGYRWLLGRIEAALGSHLGALQVAIASRVA